jgi:uncharacterized membrane protein
MENMMIKREARGILNGIWLFIVGVHLMLQAITLMLSSIVPFASILVAGIFGVGLCSISLKLVRGEPTNVSDVFDGVKNGFVNNMMAGVLVTLFTGLWSLLFIIPGVVKSYSYAMTYFILKDNPNLNPLDAIRESERMMGGNKMKLFMIDLSFLLCYFAVFIAAIIIVIKLTMMHLAFLILGIVVLIGLVVLAIIITPYKHVAHAIFYEGIRNNP